MTAPMPPTGRVVTHGEAWDLIPWLVADALPDGDARKVRAHVAVCPLCRAELAEQEAVRAAISAPGPAPDGGAAWMELERRLDMPAPNRAAPPIRAGRRWVGRLAAGSRKGLALGAGALAAALAAAVVLPQSWSTVAPGFGTLTDPPAEAAGVELRLRPVPGADPEAVAAALAAAGARPGPAGAGPVIRAYVAPDMRDEAVTALRADPLFAVVAADPLPPRE